MEMIDSISGAYQREKYMKVERVGTLLISLGAAWATLFGLLGLLNQLAIVQAGDAILPPGSVTAISSPGMPGDLFGPGGQGAVITVTTTVDDITENGNCTLREAIIAANSDTAVDACPAGNGADTIILPAGVYTLTIAGANEDAAATGDLDITDNLTIMGAGSGITIIDGNGLDRIFDIAPSGQSITVTLSGLTVRNGSAPTTGSWWTKGGGGIRTSAANTTLQDVIVSNNHAGSGDGGGIAAGVGSLTLQNVIIENNITNSGGGLFSIEHQLAIYDSVISNNTATYDGGGIYFMDAAGYFSAVISNTVVDANYSSRRGGGLYIFGHSDRQDVVLTIANSVFRNNMADRDGGGIFINGSTVEIVDSFVMDNEAGWSGGGVYNWATVEFVDSFVIDNEAVYAGGGLYNNGNTTKITSTVIRGNVTSELNGGGGIFNSSNLEIFDSQIVSNTSGNAPGGGFHNTSIADLYRVVIGDNNSENSGGGISNRGSINIADSTISNNVAAEAGGGIYNAGQGTHLATAAVINSTISGNSAAGEGGGIHNGLSAHFTLANTTVYSNTAPVGAAVRNHDLVEGWNNIIANPNDLPACNNGDIWSFGYNLSNDENCFWTEDENVVDFIEADPLLGPLAENGSRTLTHALLPGSPAYNTGNPDPLSEFACLPADQRGVSRPQSGRCDIGAFELEVIDEAITGLTTWNLSPTQRGAATALAAIVTTGSDVVYTWDYGDGSFGNGRVTHHVFPEIGVYTTVVTASNNLNFLTATTTVTIYGGIINIAPISVETNLDVGSASTISLTINNTGDTDLNWSRIIPRDNFSPDYDSSLWTKIVGGTARNESYCGTASGTRALYFYGHVAGEALFRPLNVQHGGVVQFYLKRCGSSEPSTGILFLQYSIDDGLTWQTINEYAIEDYWGPFALIQEEIPVAAQTASTQFRWFYPPVGSIGQWVIDDVRIGPGSASFLSLTAGSGVVAPGGVQTATVNLNATGLVTGTYTAYLFIDSDDLVTPQVNVPVILHVGEVPITGLAAANDSPTSAGNPTNFAATITAGSNVAYSWDFGDGQTGSGAITAHTYAAPGYYTAIVTASNALGQATATTTVTIGGPDLAVTKDGPTAVTAGQPITYNLSLINHGLITATNVILTDTLPLYTTFLTHTAAYPHTYNPATGEVAWQIGALPPAAEIAFDLYAQVAITTPAYSPITNTLAVSLAELDLVPGNNQASHAATVLPPAPVLHLSAADFFIPVQQGADASAVVTATNQGTAALENVTIASSHYGDWVTITPTGTPSLAVNETFTFTITAAPPAGQPLGHYRETLPITAANHATATFDLTHYVHPGLATVDLLVNNDTGSGVSGATVSLAKDGNWVHYEDGQPVGEEPIAYNTTAGSGGLAVMGQMETGVYSFTVTADNHLPLTGSVTISGDSFLTLTLDALPRLVFEPAQASVSVLPGGSAHLSFLVRNLGPGHAANFAISPPADLFWLSTGLPYSVTHLAAGEAMPVSLFFNPPPEIEPGVVSGNQVTVSAERISQPAVLDVTVNVVDVNAGSLVIQVIGDDDQPLPGAEITLISQTPRTVPGPNGPVTVYDWQTATTDSSGEVGIPDLTAGAYTFYAEADGYYSEIGVTQVVPGEADSNLGLNHQTVPLTTDPFSYVWTVVESPITDTYDITLEIIYESSNPALFVSPEWICPPAGGGSFPGAWFIANLGPVTMTNISLAPNYPGFNFVIDAGSILPELAPEQSMTVPYTVTSPNPAAQPWKGLVEVTAQYEVEGVAYAYTVTAPIKRCNYSGSGGGGGSWGGGWSYDNGSVEGSGNSSDAPDLPGGPPPPPSNHGEQAYLGLSGSAFLLRQAFRAFMTLTSNTANLLEDFTIDIEARDEHGLAVVNGFAITPTLPTYLGTLTGTGQSLHGEWLLVPGDLGITNTHGVPYYLRAQIAYTHNNEAHSLLTLPAEIIVYPQPQVRLQFSHSQPAANGDFYIELLAENEGYGIARGLTLELNNVTVLDDLDGNGRSLIFSLKETTINGAPAGNNGYTFAFGDLGPGESARGRWLIGVEASDGQPLINPVVTGFRVNCKQRDYQGLQLSPLVINCGEIEQIYFGQNCGPFLCPGDKNLYVGGPINTANGNYDYRQAAPAVPTVGSPLQFAWSYNSFNSGAHPGLPPFTSSLGVGWGHNFDLRLERANEFISIQADSSLPAESGGALAEAGLGDRIVLRGPDGSPVVFVKTSSGYRPAPGVPFTP
jgi:uncharacterized repeat protein (TIGR01451 family)/CSLREA domain-containing protein